jgi:hypothetical protein
MKDLSTEVESVDSLNCGVGINLFSRRTENHVMAQTLMMIMMATMMAAAIMIATMMMTVTLFKQQIFNSFFRAVVSVAENRE